MKVYILSEQFHRWASPPFPFCFEVSFAAELRARYSNGETEKTGHSFIKLFDIASVKEEEEEWRIGGAQRERY